MKKSERRSIVTGAPIVNGGLSTLQVVALHVFNARGYTRARVLVCCVCVPGTSRYSLAMLCGEHYVNVCNAVRGLLACGALVDDRGRLTVTDAGIRELEALANDLLGNVEALRLRVGLERFGRPELLSFGVSEK